MVTICSLIRMWTFLFSKENLIPNWLLFIHLRPQNSMLTLVTRTHFFAWRFPGCFYWEDWRVFFFLSFYIFEKQHEVLLCILWYLRNYTWRAVLLYETNQCWEWCDVMVGDAQQSAVIMRKWIICIYCNYVAFPLISLHFSSVCNFKFITEWYAL